MKFIKSFSHFNAELSLFPKNIARPILKYDVDNSKRIKRIFFFISI